MVDSGNVLEAKSLGLIRHGRWGKGYKTEEGVKNGSKA
jgi:hypothetical protein